MPDSFLPQNDREFVKKLTAMITEVSADLVGYGIAPATMADLVAERDALDTAITEAYHAKKLSKGATVKQKYLRKSAEAKTRIVSRLIRANVGHDDAMVIRATLRPYDRIPTRHNPITPERLAAEIAAGGVILLKWDSAGNKRNTSYLIEIRVGESPEWVFLDITSKTRYRHLNQKPGIMIRYRVSASRATGRSTHSNVAHVYS